MKFVNCNFCGSKLNKIVYELNDYQLGINGIFTLVECLNCGLLFLNPQPTMDDLITFYPNWYDAYKVNIGASILMRIGYEPRYKLVSKYKQAGRLLDVGFGNGKFLKYMERYKDWDLYGIEPLIYPYNLSIQNIKATLLNNTITDAKFASDYFDVVTWWDVLEHVPNPRECLEETYRILKPNGYLFIQTPNPISWEAKMFKSFWRGFEAPRHLYLFTPTVLIKKLEEIGFVIIISGGKSGNLSTAMRSFSYVLKYKGHKYTAKIAYFLANSLFMKILSSPIAFILRTFGISFSQIYVAQKP